MADRITAAVDSPFLLKARECYLNRRRHSKKIRKLVAGFNKTGVNQSTIKRDRSQRDNESNIVMNLLAGRKIPSFLLDIIKKKRIWNIGCIRKMGLSPSVGDDFFGGLDFIGKERQRQEQELQGILLQNEKRFEEHRKIAATLRLTRKMTVTTVAEANSSTLSLDDSESSDSNIKQQSYFDNMDGTVHVFSEEQPHDPFEFEQPMDFMGRDLDQDNLFAEMF